MTLTKKQKRLLIKTGKIAAVIAVIVLAAVIFMAYQNNSISVEQQEVYMENLPREFDGLKISVVSDLHGKEFGRGNKNLVELVAAEQPDLIAVTGDLVESLDQMDMVEPLLKGLAEIAPVYFVNGNHEWAAKAVPEIKKVIAEIDNAEMLQNRSLIFSKDGASMVLFGIEDLNGPADMKGMHELVDEIRAVAGEDIFILMLCHRNDRIGEADRCDIDLIISGHGHGGLIRLPFIGGVVGPGGELLPSYTEGLYVQGTTSMVVSRGLGNSGDTFRLFNRPQLLTVVLKYQAPIGSEE